MYPSDMDIKYLENNLRNYKETTKRNKTYSKYEDRNIMYQINNELSINSWIMLLLSNLVQGQKEI
jgi:hypothetical protein